jgi:uncharacterized protein YqjF (DUF2071 family)
MTPHLRSRPALRMGWHHLLFLHWRAEIEHFQSLIPDELEIDTFNGQAYVGLIPFSMTRVRPRYLPHLQFAPKLYDFHETNVRTYVRRRETGECGVWFFSLDAASLPAVIVARMWFHLPYFWSKMQLQIKRRGHEQGIEYSSRRAWPSPRNAGCDVRAVVDCSRAPQPAAPNTLEHFLVERYLLFSHDGRHLYRGRVAHKPYRLQPARVESCRENLIAAADIEHRGAPHVLFAPDVRVEAWPATKTA